MIYKLQRKFIFISTISVLAVVTAVFIMIFALTVSSMSKNLDILADTVSEGGGMFPHSPDGGHAPGDAPPNGRGVSFITPETPFATRHFTIFFNDSGNVVKTHTDAIASIGADEAIEYARKAVEKNNVRGWLDNYRYKVFSAEIGKGVVFIDGSMSLSSLAQSMTIAGFVLFGYAALVLLLIILLSRRAVKPIAESYEKQRQFVTDANHELKTPLTLILANLDILESEFGESEWLDDIRSEGNRMTELVNHLVALSRMDEEQNHMNVLPICLSSITKDTVSEFKPLVESRGKRLTSDIGGDIRCNGDEALIRRVISLLLDNAVKYCDAGGEIKVGLHRGRRIVLTVENTYSAVDKVELQRLFDRFYRADKARTYASGYGIGLSVAKSIVEKHKGSITAYKKDGTHIGFKVVL